MNIDEDEWREKCVSNFPQVDAEKIRKAFDDGLNAYRNPKTRYKFNNPYRTSTDFENEPLMEGEILDSVFASGWAAGVL